MKRGAVTGGWLLLGPILHNITQLHEDCLRLFRSRRFLRVFQNSLDGQFLFNDFFVDVIQILKTVRVYSGVNFGETLYGRF